MMRYAVLFSALPILPCAAQSGSLLGADLQYAHSGGAEWSFTVRTHLDPFAPSDAPELYVQLDGAWDTIPVTAQETIVTGCLETPYQNTYTWTSALSGSGVHSLYAWKSARTFAHNLPGGSDQVLCLFTEFISAPGLVNSSPVFGNDLGASYYIVNTLIHDPQLSDPDGDSLACYAIPLRGEACQGLQGFIDPVLSTPPGDDLQVDQSTGMVTWTAPNTEGRFWFAFICAEYRDGEPLGSVTRDMSICVQAPFTSIEGRPQRDASISQPSLDGPVTVRWDDDGGHMIDILDMRGAVVECVRLSGTQTTIATDEMAAGIYLVKMTDIKGIITTGRFVVAR